MPASGHRPGIPFGTLAVLVVTLRDGTAPVRVATGPRKKRRTSYLGSSSLAALTALA